jgi:hypothetical protein
VADGTAPAQRYEQLRQVALGGHADGWRHGLGVLTSRGLAVWMRAWTGASPSPAPATRPDPSPATPTAADRVSEVIAVLAQMALAHT